MNELIFQFPTLKNDFRGNTIWFTRNYRYTFIHQKNFIAIDLLKLL